MGSIIEFIVRRLGEGGDIGKDTFAAGCVPKVLWPAPGGSSSFDLNPRDVAAPASVP